MRSDGPQQLNPLMRTVPRCIHAVFDEPYPSTRKPSSPVGEDLGPLRTTARKLFHRGSGKRWASEVSHADSRTVSLSSTNSVASAVRIEHDLSGLVRSHPPPPLPWVFPAQQNTPNPSRWIGGQRRVERASP